MVLAGKTCRLAAEDDCPAAQTGTSRCDRAVGGSQGENVEMNGFEIDYNAIRPCKVLQSKVLPCNVLLCNVLPLNVVHVNYAGGHDNPGRVCRGCRRWGELDFYLMMILTMN